MAGKGKGRRISPGIDTVRVEISMPVDLRERIDRLAEPGQRNEWIRSACEEKADRQELPAQ